MVCVCGGERSKKSDAGLRVILVEGRLSSDLVLWISSDTWGEIPNTEQPQQLNYAKRDYWARVLGLWTW